MKTNRKIFLFMVLSVVLALALSLVACDKAKDTVENLLAKAPENVQYDGQYLTWDKNGADYYNVSINGGDKVRVNSTSYGYNTSDSFSVTVWAVFVGTEKATSVTFNPLAKIEQLYVADDGVVSWDAVSGANAYSVSVNGQVEETANTSYSSLKAGNNTVKVKPIVSGDKTYYSRWSNEKQVGICSTPASVKYDGTTLTWTGNANTYEVKINGVPNVVKGGSFDFSSENKDFEVEIKGIGNHTNMFDSAIASESFHYLDAVTNLVVEDGVLHWDPVDGAKGYKLRIDDVISKEKVDGKTEYDKLISGRSIRMSVLAYNDEGNYFSSWSAEKTIFLLNTPSPSWKSELELDGAANNNYVWDAINAAKGYTVSITKNGQTTTTTLTEDHRAFAHAYAEIGVYTVKVKANAPEENPDYYDSKYSEEMTIERLPAPKPAVTNFITSDASDLSKGFTVNYVAVNGAKGYQLYKDGVLVSGKYSTGTSITDTNVSSSMIASEQHYTYVVRSVGDVKTLGGKTHVRLSSLTESSLSFDITVQALPTNLYMDGYFAKWDTVVGNNGYAVGHSGNVIIAQSESLDLGTIVPGTYNVKVCTRGNGTSTLASNFTAPMIVQRLAYPTGIRIDGGEGNGLLSYNKVSNAKSYSVFLDLDNKSIDETARENMYDHITEQGTVLSMTANCNDYNEDKTVYYMTSPVSPTQQFIRLSAPTFPEGALSSHKELVWNTPENINVAEYTPTYTVFSSGVALTGQYNNTKYNLTNLEGNRDYVISVKAVGNGTKYLDSKVSKTISFFKLETPKLSIDNLGYHWSSVNNASAYVLEINGVKQNDNINVSGTTYTFMPYYNKIGTHNVRLYAVGDGVRTVSSEPTLYNQKAEALQAPTISYKYSNDSFVRGGVLSATIEKQSPHAEKYQFEIAGKTIVSGKLTESQVIESPGTYTIKAKAVGGVFDDEKTYYIDSQYTAENQIIILAPPTASSFSINADGIIKWSNVSATIGYDYQISFDNGEFSEITHIGYSSLRIENFKSYKSIKIKVRASSNGDPGRVNSEWIEWSWTNNEQT